MVAIASLEVLDGTLDRRVIREAQDWSRLNRDQLWAKWEELNP